MSNSTEIIFIYPIYLNQPPVFLTPKTSLWAVETKYRFKHNNIDNTFFGILRCMTRTFPGYFEAYIRECLSQNMIYLLNISQGTKAFAYLQNSLT